MWSRRLVQDQKDTIYLKIKGEMTMILINVNFAEMDQMYDFKVDEQVSVAQVVEEMVTMIAEKEHYELSKNPGLFLLCNPETEQIFLPMTNLMMNGVTSGITLMLV